MATTHSTRYIETGGRAEVLVPVQHVPGVGPAHRPNCYRTNTKKFFKKKIALQLCCWNVRTLLDSDKRSERRTAVVTKELARYNIDIAALAETRLAGEDQLEETGSGYTLFWSGRPEGEKREAGVGFAIRNSLLDRVERPTAVSERIMRLRLPLAADRYMSIISVYAPTLVSSEEDIAAFYHALSTLLNTIPKEEGIVLLGDFNARVGAECDTWKPLGPYGVGNVNSNGLLLLQLCYQLDLAITNTFFRQKIEHRATWFHPRSKQGHVIDFIITRRRDLRSFCKVRVMRGADCDTDHMMVRAKLKVNIRKKIRLSGVKVPKRIDVSKLKHPGVKETLASTFDSLELEGRSWDEFKKEVYEQGVNILGLRTVKHRDWFDDNSSTINELLETKRLALLRKLNSKPENMDKLSREYAGVRSHVQKRLRQIKNQWWTALAEEIQLAHNRNDSKSLYSLLRQAYGPKSPTSVPLLLKDGSSLAKSPEDIMKRWTEHFSDLFFNPSVVDFDALSTLPQSELHHSLLREPSLDEIKACLKQLNTGKAPGLDGIPVELLLHGGENLHQAIHSINLRVWLGEQAPQDWIDAFLVSLYKGKGKKSICGSYRGITILEAVGKVFARLLLNRINEVVCPEVLPESQSGFRPGRGTADMIFSARQLQEKCLEQCMPLYQVFVDLTKAFDTVNREALWVVLGKCGCPPEFVDKFKQLHRSMKAQVNFDGQLSEKFSVDNGVKQGDIPAPTLFSIYLSALLWYAFHDCDKGVHIRFRTSGKVFNLRRMNAKTMVSETLVRELLYADDADLAAHTADEMQEIMDRFANACTKFGLTISLDKTKVMFTPAPGEPYIEPDILVYGTRLAVVKSFVYLGSTISHDGSLDNEIKERIAKASSAFGRLEERVWSDRNLTINTKLSVYKTCVLSALLYASEVWTVYQRHVKLLERFHQQCLRRILSIKWQNRTPDTEVLSKAHTLSISALLMRNQMRWAGHLIRMDDSRLPKQLFYGELASGARPQHKPKKRFRDEVKVNLKHMNIPVDSWEEACVDRDEWRQSVFQGVKGFEDQQVKRAGIRRACRKFEVAPDSQWLCGVCGRVMLSKAGLVNHMKSHESRPVPVITLPLAPAAPAVVTCEVCGKTCKSSGGLKLHMKVHGGPIPPPAASGSDLLCHICSKPCRSLAGLKSHLRAHGRADRDGEDNDEGMALV